MKDFFPMRMLFKFEAIAPNGSGVILIGQQIVGLHLIQFFNRFYLSNKSFLEHGFYNMIFDLTTEDFKNN